MTMLLEIKAEKAIKGDCIWIRYGEKNISNIIVDSGPSSFAKGFRKLIHKIIENGEEIDLLVLTHIDDDHIKGFSKYIEDNDCNKIKKIWFNGHGSEVYIKNQPHSPRNVTNLINYINDKGLQVITPVYEGYIEKINEAELTVITPTEEDINNVAKEIDKFIPHSFQSIYNKDLDRIMEDDNFEKDGSKTNKASISFIFSYKNRNIAFLGDAHAEDIVKGKNKFFKDRPIHMIKLPHHGSKYNINKELIECMNAKKFIISTKGPIHKETISRIIQNVDKPIIYCNYEWWRKCSFFTNNDKKKYLNTGKLEIIALDEEEKIPM
ncbi:hypothetical protein CJF15_09355 [Clostridium botulinum]|nr:hypothetical protein [Clostridium botulinum]NFI44694.1 MBL fold metallo-hydrolase [Clostridium botulinum]NFJ89424.1 MBL fold metallo-hydrolase [Clostridium botulinum]NFR57196.1 MBL fold metallo-hydrolase [Clostridium botulinum]